MSDLEQQLGDHLRRRAGEAAPRPDLNGVDTSNSYAQRLGARPTRGRGYMWLGLAAAAVVLIGGVAALAARRDPAASSEDAAEVPTTAVLNPAPLTEVEATVADVLIDPNTPSVAPNEVPETTVLGGVTLDDPLPSQPNAVDDPAAAEVAIRYAYQHWILIDFDKDLRARIVENGEDFVDRLDEGMKNARSIAEFARVAVDAVEFTGPETANVTFRLQWQGGPSPYFPNAIKSTAVFRNGTWRVGSPTLCLLAFAGGQGCDGVAKTETVAPVALRLGVEPVGVFWSGDPSQPGLIRVPGVAEWIGGGENRLTISTEVLPGIAALGVDEADTVLASHLYGVADGDPIDVGGLRGRQLVKFGNVNLAYIRSDDVIVSIQATGLTVEQVIALPALLETLAVLPEQAQPNASDAGGVGYLEFGDESATTAADG